MKQNLLHSLLTLLLLLGLTSPARATTPPPVTGRSLAEALNSDGTLKAGANGSFDARQFRMGTAPDGRPVFSPAGTAGAGDERWADGFGLANGADAVVLAIVQSGTDIYVAGSFTSVGLVKANHIARWNGAVWSSVGTGAANGTDSSVSALAVAANGDIYAGGYFSQAGGMAANRVARWNGSAWSSLGAGPANGVSNGINNVVSSLVIASSGDMYVGGRFSQAGGAPANNVARWNGTAWNSLGTGLANGVNGAVNALALASNGDVYVGGIFVQAGTVAVNRLARWNGTGWSSMNSGVATGLSEYVSALAVAANGDLYAGGRFTRFGGVAANYVARWNGTSWTSLGAGTGSANGVNNDVSSLTVAGNGDVYVTGYFNQAGGAIAKQMARWDGTAWNSVGAGAANGTNGGVRALTLLNNGALYAVGGFSDAGGVAANRVARFDGAAWHSVGTSTVPSNGVSGLVDAIVVAGNGDIYVAGSFTELSGMAANSVARWNGTTWASLGVGSANGVFGIVYAVALASNGDVYVSGAFTQAGGMPANNVARWDGTAWSSLGTGITNGRLPGSVYTLAVAGNGDVYAGGYFNQAGGAPANNIARWNGTSWNPLGTGTDDDVLTLVMAGNGDVYVGGSFSQAGGVVANKVARWNGVAWSSLGTGTANGVNEYVRVLKIAGNGDLYAGGGFTQAGGVLTNSLARWNGTAWSSVGNATSFDAYEEVTSLAVSANGDIYAGGYFTQVDGVPAKYIARWNGTAWSTLGTGLNNTVSALGVGLGGKVYAGGYFTGTGDDSKLMAHFGIYDPNAPLATAALTPKAAPAALFPNPAHGTATLRLPVGAPRLSVTLTDALGRIVRRYPTPAGPEAELDLRGLPAGVYVVGCGQLTQRLVVE